MALVRIAAALLLVSGLGGCRDNEGAPFIPRILPHDGGVDGGEFDPPQTGASTGNTGSIGSTAPRVSDDGCVSSFSDNFNAGINPSVWLTSNDCNSRVQASEDQVMMRMSGGCGNVDVALFLRDAFLCGDFEVAVDYRLPQWNSVDPGERWAMLMADERNSAGEYVAIERVGGENGGCRDGANMYVGWAAASSVCDAITRGDTVTTSATSGRIRVTRRDGSIAAYIGGGTPIAEGPAPDGPMELSLRAGTTGAPNLVMWDNITVTVRR